MKVNFDEYENFRSNVKTYRHKSDLTQEQLAERIKCSVSYIKQIESQKEFKNVTLITLMKICDALDINLVDLFTFNDHDKTES